MKWGGGKYILCALTWLIVSSLARAELHDPELSLEELQRQNLFGAFPAPQWSRFVAELEVASSGSIDNAAWTQFLFKYQAYQMESPTVWDNKDQALLAMSSWPTELWQKILATSPMDLQIFTERHTPQILRQACGKRQLNPSVRSAACLSLYGLQRTPAFISEALVIHFGGQASAFSSLLSHEAVIFEGYRPDTFTELIQIHEGFHSAMRRLGNLNRISRLQRWVKSPLAPGWVYDSRMQQLIESLEQEAAPGLHLLAIDQRFTSDHHGVIMASLHHGLWQAWFEGFLDHDQPEDLITVYPFHYLAHELNWTESFMWSQVESLREVQNEYLEQNTRLGESLTYLENHLQDPSIEEGFSAASF